jgi:hypothetical protein
LELHFSFTIEGKQNKEILRTISLVFNKNDNIGIAPKNFTNIDHALGQGWSTFWPKGQNKFKHTIFKKL